MANKKTSAKADTMAADAAVQECSGENAQAAVASAPKKKERIRFDDSTLVRVKSNTFGKLVYINKRTGDRTVWAHFGDEQAVTMADLRAMKGAQNSFFSDNMIVILGCEDDRYEDAAPSDLYDALLVSKYYKDFLDPDRFGTLFQMSEAEIRERVSQLSANGRLNLIVALNNAINGGALDSLRKIRLFEELLGCDLAAPQQ